MTPPVDGENGQSQQMYYFKLFKKCRNKDLQQPKELTKLLRGGGLKDEAEEGYVTLYTEGPIKLTVIVIYFYLTLLTVS